MPDANVVLREHVLSLKRHQDSAALTLFGVLVTKRHGPFMLRREYLVDESTARRLTFMRRALTVFDSRIRQA